VPPEVIFAELAIWAEQKGTRGVWRSDETVCRKPGKDLRKAGKLQGQDQLDDQRLRVVEPLSEKGRAKIDQNFGGSSCWAGG
jgi:hypothetical protein